MCEGRYTAMASVCYNAWYMKEEQPLYQERIVADPRILAGKPVVKGTRIGVDLVLEELSHNPDVHELLAAHPDLTRDDVQACLAYAKDICSDPQSSGDWPTNKGTRRPTFAANMRDVGPTITANEATLFANSPQTGF